MSATHQFREFEFSDHLKLPTKVAVFGNRDADGGWTNVVTGEWEDATESGDYVEIVQYHLAETLTTEAALDDRAEVLALRQHMEESLGKLVTQMHCGIELYDYIEVKDIRGAAAYTVYPTDFRSGRWDNKMVVGSIVRIFDPERGRYEIELTFNGISSEPPDFKTVPKTEEEIEEEIEEIIEDKIPEIPDGGLDVETPTDGRGGGIGGWTAPPIPGATPASGRGFWPQHPVPVETTATVPVVAAAGAAATVGAAGLIGGRLPAPMGAPIPGLDEALQGWGGIPVPQHSLFPQPVSIATTLPAITGVSARAGGGGDRPPGWLEPAVQLAGVATAGITVGAVGIAAPATLPALLPASQRLAPAIAEAWRGGSLF